jgi:NAD(P)H dehydrogenase (quinone)
MVTFEQAIREGFLAIRSDDVEALTNHKPRSVRELIEANRELLVNA